MIIAVDFDGTIVEQKYPKLGKEIPFATSTLKLLQEEGHRLILWTYRAGRELDEAVAYCRSKGLEFYAINKNYPEEIFDESISRKIKADMYIDDMNYGGLPDWGEIYEGIQGRNKNGRSKKKKGFRLFG
ncbi:BT0820 family HAD-type phosphatase [Marinifilum sp. D737]|uniref:BT0820 family HAD-type phosphatase n=1 Tax=Marinifilum sp. D737 TaxID=2969628 RepID=UPI00227463E0|nr:hydrolase [Marinifilum sp. D737]MCY1635020.1 hydrolase [Marinifilum sp. D737]